MNTYRTAEPPEASGPRVELENLASLQARNAELERQIAAGLRDLQVQAEREQLLATIACQIRSSLNLTEVLNAAVAAVRAFLHCDRLLVYRFEPDWSGTVMAESADNDWPVTLYEHINVSCWHEQTIARYSTGQITAIDNIDTAGYSDCYRQLLHHYQVKASLVVPILVGGQLWGLLLGHHCTDVYHWEQSSFSLLETIAVHLAIAIQHATAYEQVQTKLAEHQRTAVALQKSEATNRAILQAIPDLLTRLSAEGYYLSFDSGSNVNTLYPVDQTRNNTPHDVLPTALAEQKLQAIQRALATQSLQVYEQELDIAGIKQYEEVRIAPVGDNEVLAIVRNISERKRSEAERQRAERALLESEQRFSSLAAAAPVGIFRTDIDGNCLDVNACWCEITGLRPDEAIGMGWVTGLHPLDRERVAAAWYQSAQNNCPFKLEYRFQRPDGHITWVLGQAAAERDLKGQVTGYIGTLTNISEQARLKAERKEAEFLLKIQNTILQRIAKGDVLPDILDALTLAIEEQLKHGVCSILLCDGAGKLHHGSSPNLPQEYIRAVDGISVAEGVGSCGTAAFRRDLVIVSNIASDPLWQSFSPPALAHNLQACWSVPIIASDGQVLGTFAVYHHQVYTPQAPELEIVALAANMAGIAIERQQSELALRQREAQLAEAQRVAHIGNWELDVETETMSWSAELFRILGRDPALAEPNYPQSLQLYHPDDAAQLHQAVTQAIAAGESFQLLLRVPQPDGSWLYVEAIAQAKFNRQGLVTQLFGTVQDVTVRVQAENALQDLVEGTAAVTGDDFFPALVKYLSSALGSSHTLVSELTDGYLQTRAFWSRDQLQPNFKYCAERSPCQLVLKTGFYCHAAQVQQSFPHNLDLTTLKAESYLGIALTDATGQPIGVLCLLYDHPITDIPRLQSILQIFAARAAAELEREQATQALEQLNQALETKVEERTAALRQSEERWQLVLRGTNDGIFDWDVQHQRVFYSSRWKEMRGFTEAEIGDTLEEWSQRVHPDDYERALLTVAEHFAGKTEFYELQYRTRCKNNTYMWILARGQAQRDEQGQVKRLSGSETDITQRKQAEADRDRLLSLLEASLNEIYVFDAVTLQFQYANQGAVQNLGYSPEALKSMTPLDLNLDFTEIELRQRLQPLLDRQRDKLILETRQHRADGSSYAAEIHLQQHQYQDEHNQNEQVFLAVILDMTERQQTAQELRDLSARLELAIQSAQIGIWEWDIVRDRLIWDNRMCELHGIRSKDFTGAYSDWKARVHPDDWPTSQEAIQQALQGKRPFEPEFRVILPDDSIRVLKANSITQYNAQGEPRSMIGINYDITELKRTEETLRQQKETLQTIFDHIPLMLGLFSPIGEVRMINREMERVIGWTQADYHQIDVLDACYPDLEAQVKFLQHMFAANSTWQDFQTTVRDQRVLTTTWSHIRLSDGSTIGIGQDITDRKQAEMALQESQRFIQQIAEASPNILYIYDLQEQRNVYVNREIGTILGYTPAQIQTMEANLFQTLMHPDDLDRIVAQQAWFDSAQDGDILETEYRMRHANGEWRWLYSRDAIFSRDLQGQVKQTIGAAQDISERKRSEVERKQAEVALRLSEERFRHYFEQSLVGMAITSAEKGWVEVNDRLCEILGYSREELTQLTWLEMTHPADIDSDVAYFDQVIAGEIEGYSIDKQFIRKDGQLIDTSISAQSIRQANGVLDCLIVLVQDITDRKRLEAEQNRLLAILQASTDYIAISDAEGQILWKNAELDRLWGTSAQTSFWQLHITDCHPQWATNLILHEGFPQAIIHGSWVGETALLDADQQEIPVSQLILAHKSPQGDVEYFSAIMRDVRARKEYEQQLERSNADLARATRLKDEFLANMSHELRTPLNAILGMSEGLQESAFGLLNERQSKAIATIERSGRHLLELINDILDLSKIEAGKLTLDLNPVSIQSLCQGSIAFIKQLSFKKQISLNVQLSDSVKNLNILADDRRIRQVLINLLNNAVKFTPEGGTVTLEVQLETAASNPNFAGDRAAAATTSGLLQQTIIFSILDTGIGIAPANLSQLFHAFVQIDSSLNRQYAGTGLGLALVKRIVELHGGTVSVTSELNCGSCFKVHLPLVHGTTHDPVPAEQSLNLALMPANNSQVVVIDDAPAAADLVARYLHDLGLQATIYHYGEGACSEILRLQPALIILDLQLPNISGWDVLAQLKQHPNTQNIPVIVTSVVDELQRGLSLGASAYLVKPFTRSEFKAVLQRLRSPLPDLAAAATLPLILLAEDNVANIETLTGYLESRGYGLIVAETGQQAIDLAQAHSPDIILMDIQMPGMDGLEATRRIREQSELAQTPIIALTALAMPGDREKCLAAGANQYLTKPIRLKELVTTIQALLQPRDCPG